jgi:hypothetical protein
MLHGGPPFGEMGDDYCFKFGFIGAINPSEIRFQRMKSSRGEDEIRLRRMKSALRAGCGTDPSGLFIKIQF